MKAQAMTVPTNPAPFVPRPPTGRPPLLTRSFWLSGAGIAVGLSAILLTAIIIALAVRGVPRAADSVKVAVTGCKSTAGDLPSATVEFTVTNTGKTTRTVRLSIEYRDNAGARLDTDTSTVRDIVPGDTVRSSESTLLDAGSASVTCEITSVS